MRESLLASLRKITDTFDKSTIRLSVLGVGSELRGDDAAGLMVAEKLIKKCGDDKCGIGAKLQVLYGETAPENFTGEIKRFAPTHLIIIDAAEMGEKPGNFKIIRKEEIKGITFSTHVLPLSVMVDYLSNSINFDTLVIGVEPKDTAFDHAVSTEVKSTVDAVSDAIYTFAKELGGK
jgi:hydrogenase 3 maturation protease